MSFKLYSDQNLLGKRIGRQFRLLILFAKYYLDNYTYEGERERDGRNMERERRT